MFKIPTPNDEIDWIYEHFADQEGEKKFAKVMEYVSSLEKRIFRLEGMPEDGSYEDNFVDEY